MRYVTYLLAALAVALGVAAVIGGEVDDSPGLQLIGALLALGGLVFAVRTARRRT
jgi:MYXO-CTERM domain-containing protein